MNFVEAEEEQRLGLMVDVAVTTREERTHNCEGEQRSSPMVDVALINPDGDGSHRQIHEERTHAHKEDCPGASREHSRRGYRHQAPRHPDLRAAARRAHGTQGYTSSTKGGGTRQLGTSLEVVPEDRADAVTVA